MDSWPAPMAQLRLHTRWAGHGIVGDWTYGAAAGSPPPPADGGTDAANEEYKVTAERANRMMLHSHRLRLPFEVRSAAPAAPRLRRGAALQMVCNHLSALGPSLAHALCTENRLSCAAGAAPRSAGSPARSCGGAAAVLSRDAPLCTARAGDGLLQHGGGGSCGSQQHGGNRRELVCVCGRRPGGGAGRGGRAGRVPLRPAGGRLTGPARRIPAMGLQGPGVTPCVTWPSPSQCAVTAVAR
jgi:hypothetical protein